MYIYIKIILLQDSVRSRFKKLTGFWGWCLVFGVCFSVRTVGPYSKDSNNDWLFSILIILNVALGLCFSII